MKRMDARVALCGVACLVWLSSCTDKDQAEVIYRLIQKGGDWLAKGARLEPFKGYGFGDQP